MIRIRFFGPGELNQNGLGTAQYLAISSAVQGHSQSTIARNVTLHLGVQLNVLVFSRCVRVRMPDVRVRDHCRRNCRLHPTQLGLSGLLLPTTRSTVSLKSSRTFHPLFCVCILWLPVFFDGLCCVSDYLHPPDVGELFANHGFEE